MKGPRGYTLIELMIALAVLSVGAGLVVGEVSTYRAATERARAVEAITRVLDQEMERLRACPDMACLEAARAETATLDGLGPAAASWARPRVKRTWRPGPDGTLEVTVQAELPGLVPPRALRALVARPGR